MGAMATRTIPVSSKELESAIEVLSNVGHTLQLTRFERFSYRALMVSVDVAAVCFLFSFIIASLPIKLLPEDLQKSPEGLAVLVFSPLAVYILSLLVALVLLALNIPVFLKTA